MYERILVGTDGSERSMIAVERARQLAELTGAELHVVEGCGTPVVVAPFSGDTVGVVLPDLMETAEQQLRVVASRLADSTVTVHTHAVPEGGADALLDVADAIAADLIVVGNRGMTGIRRVLGSVPSTVAHHAHCAVLIVPTDG